MDHPLEAASAKVAFRDAVPKLNMLIYSPGIDIFCKFLRWPAGGASPAHTAGRHGLAS